jgi:hypothetical protein
LDAIQYRFRIGLQKGHLTTVDEVDSYWIDVVRGNFSPFIGERHRQRQANMPTTTYHYNLMSHQHKDIRY